MENILVKPKKGETFKDLTERLKLPYTRGSGYYRLTKSEQITEKKDLVLIKNDTWFVGSVAVRMELGLGSGEITLAHSDLPKGSELFVQSTSPNRKLPFGKNALIRLAKDQLTGTEYGKEEDEKKPKATTKSKKASPKKRRRDVEDDDEDADGDDDEEKKPSTKPKAKPYKKPAPESKKKSDDDDAGVYVDDDGDDNGGSDKSNNQSNAVVAWPSLLFDLDEGHMDDQNELIELVVGASDSGVRDLPVPTDLVQDTVERVHNYAIRNNFATWTQTERLVVPVPSHSRWANPPRVRYQWRSGDKRLMYAHAKNATIVALEVGKQNWGLVCGNRGGHPFVHSPQLGFSKSHRYSRELPLNHALVTPETVLAKLVRDTVLHLLPQHL